MNVRTLTAFGGLCYPEQPCGDLDNCSCFNAGPVCDSPTYDSPDDCQCQECGWPECDHDLELHR